MSAGDPICPDCGQYLSNTADPVTGFHRCPQKVTWADFHAAISKLKGYQQPYVVVMQPNTWRLIDIWLGLTRRKIMFEHWARYPQKGKRAKRLKERLSWEN